MTHLFVAQISRLTLDAASGPMIFLILGVPVLLLAAVVALSITVICLVRRELKRKKQAQQAAGKGESVHD